ncbi:DUF4331 family protein [Microbacterium timonense]|uniref:DUF4331 family protein n=1 Tax=Microbacterium timonense TaxID=2086576 RepID=UPI000D0EBB29|nr:DUF4331 family protein [Microbacterium timonense]
MSHHLDSPIARQDVRLDITDLYAFRGETGTVVIINVSHSLGNPPIPGFHHEGMYEFKFDTDHDAEEEITYRFVFDERASDGSQRFVLRRLDGDVASDPFAEGRVVAQGGTDTAVLGEDGIRVWAGEAGDPFWIEPTVLHAVGHAVQDGTKIELGDWVPAEATNFFAGHSVYAIVLEVPDAVFDSEIEPKRVGIWAVASLQTDAGGWRSINRIGLPMIHPLFTQFNEQLGDDLNAGRPSDDEERYGDLLRREVAGIVRAYGTSEDPEAYAAGVVARFLPNILPYTIGTAASFGFNGWNGRTLTDNAPDVMFSIAANTPVALGIGKESVTDKPSASFPYVPAVPAGR